MTTPAAERLYLAQHEVAMQDKRNYIFNPHNKPLHELPVVYGFNNGGRPGWYYAVLLAEDGTCLGGHCCSHEGYMKHDLGILVGTRPDRHENDIQPHYPDGYRMEFVSSEFITEHEGLQKAIKEANYREEREAANADVDVEG